MTDNIFTEIDRKLLGLLSLMSNQDAEAGKRRKSEVILRQAGLTVKEIALVVGKNEAAVHQTLHRSGLSKKKRK